MTQGRNPPAIDQRRHESWCFAWPLQARNSCSVAAQPRNTSHTAVWPPWPLRSKSPRCRGGGGTAEYHGDEGERGWDGSGATGAAGAVD